MSAARQQWVCVHKSVQSYQMNPRHRQEFRLVFFCWFSSGHCAHCIYTQLGKCILSFQKPQVQRTSSSSAQLSSTSWFQDAGSMLSMMHRSVDTRASNEGSRRFHNNGEGPFYLWAECESASRVLFHDFRKPSFQALVDTYFICLINVWISTR